MSDTSEKKNFADVPPETVIDAIHAGKPDFDNPPELSEEEKARNAKLGILKKSIIERANEYVATAPADRPGKKYLLAEIQEIVNEVEDAFVLMVYDAAGIPTCITFEPNGTVPEDSTIHSGDSLDAPKT